MRRLLPRPMTHFFATYLAAMEEQVSCLAQHGVLRVKFKQRRCSLLLLSNSNMVIGVLRVERSPFSVTSQIIKDHKGELQFESEPGAGTVAIVSLPATQEKRTA